MTRKRMFDQMSKDQGDEVANFIPKVTYTQREFDFYEKRRELKEALDSIVKIPPTNYSPKLDSPKLDLDSIKKGIVEDVVNFYIEYKDIIAEKFNLGYLEETIKNKLVEFHLKWPDWAAELYQRAFDSPIPPRRVFGTSGGRLHL